MSDQFAPGLGSEALLQSFLLHHTRLGEVQHRQRVQKRDQPLCQLWEGPELLGGGVHFSFNLSHSNSRKYWPESSAEFGWLAAQSVLAAGRSRAEPAGAVAGRQLGSVFIGGVSLLSGVQELDWATSKCYVAFGSASCLLNTFGYFLLLQFL